MLAAPLASAADFKIVGAAPAVLYDAPSERGRKLFVAPRGMPVEVVLSYGDWVKVRDMNGDLTWIEAKALSPRRTVVVKSANAKVRTTADENAAVVMSADRGVLLELVDTTPSGWIKVRHRMARPAIVKAATSGASERRHVAAMTAQHHRPGRRRLGQRRRASPWRRATRCCCGAATAPPWPRWPRSRDNHAYLPGFPLPAAMTVTGDFDAGRRWRMWRGRIAADLRPARWPACVRWCCN